MNSPIPNLRTRAMEALNADIRDGGNRVIAIHSILRAESAIRDGGGNVGSGNASCGNLPSLDQ